MNMKFLSMKLKTIFHTIHRQKNKNKQMRPHETSVQNLLYSFCKKLLYRINKMKGNLQNGRKKLQTVCLLRGLTFKLYKELTKKLIT